MPRIELNGVSLWAETHGRSGSPVVMVHGSWVDHRTWDLVAPRFAETRVVISYDRRGHSQSERPASQSTVHDDVADLAALIEHWDFAPAHLVGNSFGGSICLRLAAQRPELIRSLVVHEPPLFDIAAQDPAMAWIPQAFRDHVGPVVECLNAGDMVGGARRFVGDAGPAGWDEMPPDVRETFITNAPTFLEESCDPDWLDLDLEPLKAFARPALITHGDMSIPIFAPIAQRIADGIPAASRHTFNRAGHAPHQTHPDDFVRVVSSFIG